MSRTGWRGGPGKAGRAGLDHGWEFAATEPGPDSPDVGRELSASGQKVVGSDLPHVCVRRAEAKPRVFGRPQIWWLRRRLLTLTSAIFGSTWADFARVEVMVSTVTL